ncbi:amino acid permease [Kitasatospora sp. NPDC059648]|uniref:amino acid permease n=1 Tax=Kitasatospora sp. NPDC059648 TaxID=3346894 RepID=UPI0036951C79
MPARQRRRDGRPTSRTSSARTGKGLFSTSGPGMALLLLLVAPLIYSVPHVLVCAELGTAIPVDGGSYHWVRRGLGNFWGFQQGMLSWLCSFVDMAVYPNLSTTCLQSMAHWAAPGKHVLFTAGHFQFDLGGSPRGVERIGLWGDDAASTNDDQDQADGSASRGGTPAADEDQEQLVPPKRELVAALVSIPDDPWGEVRVLHAKLYQGKDRRV